MKLYLEDLQRIRALLDFPSDHGLDKDESWPQFEVGESQCNDLNVLQAESPETLRSLSIERHWPHISIDISGNKSWVYADRDDTRSRGIVSEVGEILEKRKRPLMGVLQNDLVGFLIGAIFYGAGVVNVLALVRRDLIPEWESGLASLVAITVGILGALRLGSKNKSNLIILKRQSEALNFFQRNRDRLLVELLVGLILVIVAFVLGRSSA